MKSMALIVNHDENTMLFCGLDASLTCKDFSYGTDRTLIDTNNDLRSGKLNLDHVYETVLRTNPL